MRDQALVAQFFNKHITIDDKNTDLSLVNRILLHNEYLVTIVKSRLHTVTADRNNIISLFSLG